MTERTEEPAARYRLAIRRPVTTAMLFLTLIVFGWRAYQGLSLTLMPDISYPSLTIRTEYEGAAPEDVEMLVTRPLEELVSIVGGLVEVSSISSAGLSQITLEFRWGTDMRTAQQEVRDRMDLFELPREIARKPSILRYNPALDPVMRIAITTEDAAHAPGSSEERAALTAIRNAAEQRLKSALEARDGIAQVRIKGGNLEEIQVLLDVENVKSLGISPEYVANTLAQQNINLSGGRLREGETEYIVRTLNEFRSVSDIADSIIVLPNGVQRQLKELARVFMGEREKETIVRINGREAVSLDFYKEGDANTVSVCTDICNQLNLDRPLSALERLMQLARQRQQAARKGSGEEEPDPATRPTSMLDQSSLGLLPTHARVSVITDQSRFIRGAIKEVQQAALFGGLLALIILFLFLQELRSTIIIGLAIPISVVAAFIPMFFQDISLNIMSLGGLALGVGMLVDNSIIVLESIYRCREEGDGIRDAAERGTREVAGAVTSSTLTTVCVFLPVAFVEGIAGQLFGDLAMTVAFSLLASLLTALYLIPLLASRTMDSAHEHRHVVWMMRAYNERRQALGHGRFRACIGIPIQGTRYAAQFLRTCFQDMFSPLAAVCKHGQKRFILYRPVFYLGGIALIPLLLFLFLLRLLTGGLLTSVITLLFLFAIPCYLAYRLLRLAISALLYLPLYLYAFAYGLASRSYAFLLRHTLRFGPLVLLFMAIASVHAFTVARGLGRELMPPMQQGEFRMRMEIRAGARLEETETRAELFEQLIRRHPEVASVSVEVGRESGGASLERGANVAEFSIVLDADAMPPGGQDRILEMLRQEIAAAASDEVITFSQPSLFSFKGEVELFIVGDSLEELRRVGNAAIQSLAAVPGLNDLEISMRPGYPELIIEMDRTLLAERGLSPSQAAARLRQEIQGDTATRFNRGAHKVDIRVRADQAQLQSVTDLENLSITDGPVAIPLRDVAALRVAEGPSEIRRINQRRAAAISGSVSGRSLADVTADMDAVMKNIAMPPDMYWVQSGQRRELDTAFESLRFALLLAVFLVYVVMACQFESIIQPALVMFTAPMAFIGVVYALWLANENLSVMVFLGGIVLAGIVVNDAIILVDYVNQLRARGLKKQDAIIEAGKARLRPIIMTTATTVLGLAPMLLASGEGAEMRRPMALTLIAGLTSATVLTLFIIPMAYHLFTPRDRT